MLLPSIKLFLPLIISSAQQFSSLCSSCLQPQFSLIPCSTYMPVMFFAHLFTALQPVYNSHLVALSGHNRGRGCGLTLTSKMSATAELKAVSKTPLYLNRNNKTIKKFFYGNFITIPLCKCNKKCRFIPVKEKKLLHRQALKQEY